jgi:hypothetical protein
MVLVQFRTLLVPSVWCSGKTGNIPEVGFNYFGRLGLENAKGRMGNITGDAEPIAWCG